MSVVKIWKRLSNKRGRAKAHIQDCRYKMEKLKFDHVGHLARRGKDRWERKVLDYVARCSKRKVGRSAVRWVDKIRQHTRIAWRRDVQVKHWWKRVGEVFAGQ